MTLRLFDYLGAGDRGGGGAEEEAAAAEAASFSRCLSATGVSSGWGLQGTSSGVGSRAASLLKSIRCIVGGVSTGEYMYP